MKKAKYTHDCVNCKLIGSAVRGGMHHDLYKCVKSTGKYEYVARFSDEPSDYGTPFYPGMVENNMPLDAILSFSSFTDWVLFTDEKPKAQKATAIVTRDSIKLALSNPNPAYRAAYVARAVAAIYQYQTDAEKAAGATVVDNGVGFAACDAFLGKITAEGYAKYGKPLPKFVDAWSKPNKHGFPRLAKYHSQLNKIAIAKKEAQA